MKNRWLRSLDNKFLHALWSSWFRKLVTLVMSKGSVVKCKLSVGLLTQQRLADAETPSLRERFLVDSVEKKIDDRKSRLLSNFIENRNRDEKFFYSYAGN